MAKALILEYVCMALANDSVQEAVEIINRAWPYCETPASKRRYSPRDLTLLFIRDGFIDRYSGERLIYPPVFRVISAQIPRAFPYHLHWRTEKTHPAVWKLAATLDHVVPVTVGGQDDLSNWVTTSMVRNSAKMNFSLQELGWTLHPQGDPKRWDGLMGWFVEQGRRKPELLNSGALRNWHRVAEAAISSEPTSGCN